MKTLHKLLWLGAGIALASMAVVTVCFVFKKSDDSSSTRVTVHPEFGQVYTAEISEKDFGIKLGSTLLSWSQRNNVLLWHSGYIYMGGPFDLLKTPIWEFALSRKKRLTEVTHQDLAVSTFYGMNDARGHSVFGSAWRTNSIIVPEHQIFFARLVTNRSMVYLVRLAKQGGTDKLATMRFEYVVANQGQ